MKKRMTILALLLAGAVTLGSYGMVQAGQEKREVPVAGVTQTLAQVLKEAGGVQAQTADVVEELQSNAAVARMMEPEMVAEEAWETAEIAENELPQTASEFADIAVAQVNHYVNVRQEPDTESEILGKLYDKSAATVLETTEDGWYRITSGNVNGYVKAEYVVVGDEELARSVGTRLATVTTTTLFVRTEPTTEAKVLTMLPDGDDVVVTDESTEGWAKVSTADGDGYVALDYVTLSTEYIHAESKAEEEARLAREEAERQAAARAAEEARKAREAEAARAVLRPLGRDWPGSGGVACTWTAPPSSAANLPHTARRAPASSFPNRRRRPRPPVRPAECRCRCSSGYARAPRALRSPAAVDCWSCSALLRRRKVGFQGGRQFIEQRQPSIRTHRANAAGGVFADFDESGLFQQFDVMGHGRAGQCRRFGQLPHRLRPMAHQLHQQLLPVRILQRLEQRNALVEDFQAPDRLVTCLVACRRAI